MAKILSRVKKTFVSEHSNGTPPAAVELAIDFPQEGEFVRPGHYAIRLTAPAGSQVEISINDGNWELCRHAVGYYWYDWTPGKAGSQELVARSKIGKGKWKKSDARRCSVESPKK